MENIFFVQLLQDFQLLYGEGEVSNALVVSFNRIILNTLKYAEESNVAYLRSVSTEAKNASEGKHCCTLYSLLSLIFTRLVESIRQYSINQY
jgi:hypothetical protein